MSADSRKRKPKKPSSNTARVIAVRRLPSDDIPAAFLTSLSPYVTDNGYTEFFEELSEILSSMENLQTAPDEAHEKAIQEAKKYIAMRLPPVSPELAAIALSGLQESLYQGVYKPTKSNPLFAIEAFVGFHHLGFYPPLWVLEWLNAAFLSFIEAKGEKSLDSLLGVTPKRGQDKKWDQMGAIEIEAKIMQEIAKLNGIGISITDAAVMVAGHLEAAKIVIAHAPAWDGNPRRIDSVPGLPLARLARI